MSRSSRRSFVLTAAFALCAVASQACGTVKRPDGGSGLLTVGADAPEVVGFDVAGAEVRLSALKGKKKAVVYFYPKDGSPGCTTEACAFRDTWDRYTAANVAVIGVSSDSPESHRAFLKDKKLPFALASDESDSIASSYGVTKRLWGYSRVSFLVGTDGKIAHVWPDVDPGVHADDVLQAAKAMK